MPTKGGLEMPQWHANVVEEIFSLASSGDFQISAKHLHESLNRKLRSDLAESIHYPATKAFGTPTNGKGRGSSLLETMAYSVWTAGGPR